MLEMVTVINIGLTLVAGYALWRTIRFVQTYLFLCKICRHPSVTPIGQVHWFWGNLKQMPSVAEAAANCKNVMNASRTKVLSIWLMFLPPMFFVIHPDSAKVLLKSSEPKPKAFAEPYYPFIPWLGDGLSLSDGQKWERNRRLLTPAFHFDVLRPYVKIYNEVANILIDRLVKHGNNGKESVEVGEPLCDATLDTVLKCGFSLDSGIQKDGEYHPYSQAVRRISALLIKKFMKPWCHFDFIYRLYSEGREFFRHIEYIHSYVDNLTRQRKNAVEKDPTLVDKKRLDFLDILLTAKDEGGLGLTEKEIRDEVNTFLFAGHDTSSSTLTWTIYCLGKYPDEQEKVYEEVHGIMGAKEDIEWEDIQKMPIMTMFIKETQRVYPTITAIDRKLTKDTEIDGVTYPAGVVIGIVLSLIHMHPDVWDNPEEFRPDRFSDTAPARDPYSFVPFSAGPRNCIGQNFAMNEMKVILSKILNRYKLVLDEDHVVEKTMDLTLKAKYGVKVKLEPR